MLTLVSVSIDRCVCAGVCVRVYAYACMCVVDVVDVATNVDDDGGGDDDDDDV